MQAANADAADIERHLARHAFGGSVRTERQRNVLQAQRQLVQIGCPVLHRQRRAARGGLSCTGRFMRHRQILEDQRVGAALDRFGKRGLADGERHRGARGVAGMFDLRLHPREVERDWIVGILDRRQRQIAREVAVIRDEEVRRQRRRSASRREPGGCVGRLGHVQPARRHHGRDRARRKPGGGKRAVLDLARERECLLGRLAARLHVDLHPEPRIGRKHAPFERLQFERHGHAQLRTQALRLCIQRLHVLRQPGFDLLAGVPRGADPRRSHHRHQHATRHDPLVHDASVRLRYAEIAARGDHKEKRAVARTARRRRRREDRGVPIVLRQLSACRPARRPSPSSGTAAAASSCR